LRRKSTINEYSKKKSYCSVRTVRDNNKKKTEKKYLKRIKIGGRKSICRSRLSLLEIINPLRTESNGMSR